MGRVSPYPELRRAIVRALAVLKGKLMKSEDSVENLAAFAMKWRPQLRELQSWKVAVSAIERDPTWAAHLNKYYEAHSHLMHLTPSLLIRSILFPMIHANGFAFSEPLFDELYKNMIGFMLATQRRFLAIGVLTNAESETEILALPGSHTLKRLTPQQRSDLRKELGEIKPRDWVFDDEQPSCAIEIAVVRNKRIPVRRPKGVPEWPLTAAEKMHRILTAMRLVRTGRVGLQVIMFRNQDWIPDGTVMTLTTSQVPKDAPYMARMVNGELLSQIFTLLDKPPQYLNIALRRFDLSYERERLDDRLIDLMICLEALYAKDSHTELSYRISLRSALATGIDQADRRKTFDWLRKAYEIRSDIVHGKEVRKVLIGGADVTLDALVAFTEQNVREAIRFFLFHPRTESQGTVLDTLDQMALTL